VKSTKGVDDSSKTTNKGIQDWATKRIYKLMQTVIAARGFPCDAAK
jgi:hypothetical protein